MDVTATALDEIEAVLDGALDYGGAEHAREVRDRFKRLFDILDRGIGLGSPRPELGLPDDVRIISTKPYPFLIVIDRKLGLVLRLIHARNDYSETIISDDFPLRCRAPDRRPNIAAVSGACRRGSRRRAPAGRRAASSPACRGGRA